MFVFVGIAPYRREVDWEAEGRTILRWATITISLYLLTTEPYILFPIGRIADQRISLPES